MDNLDEDEALAKGLRAMENLNKSLCEPNGRRLQAITEPDGSTQLEALGSALLSDTSMQAQLLLGFLQDTYRVNAEKNLETTKEIGHALIACMQTEKLDPNSEFAQTFRTLNNAWLVNRD